MIESIPDWVKKEQKIDSSNLEENDIEYLVKWIRENQKSPIDYLVKKSQDHQVVFLGEQHEIEDYLQFLIDSVPYIYHQANIDTIGLEVCNQEDNNKLKKLVTAEKFDESLQLEIARSQNWQAWAFKDYWDILKAVWKFNRTLSEDEEKLLVKGVDRKINLPKIHNWLTFGNEPEEKEKEKLLKNAKEYGGKRDEIIAKIIEEDIINNEEKAVILIGNDHCFTNYKIPMIKDGKITDEKIKSAAYMLKEKYEDEIFSIRLHSPLSAVKNFKEDHLGGAENLGGIIDKVIKKADIKRTAINILDSPFSSIRNNKCLLFYNQENITYKNVFQGYIVVAPLAKLYSCEIIPDFITEEMFENCKGFYSNKFGRKFEDVDELNDFFYHERKKAFPEINN